MQLSLILEASPAITPFESDFVDKTLSTLSDLTLIGMTNGLQVTGTGLVIWIFTDMEGNNVHIESMAYHIPTAKVHLLCPLCLFEQPGGTGGYFSGDKSAFTLHLGKHRLSFPYHS